ncbi:MAG: hypothetical protein IT566_07435, partial [Rhodospirillaceae bacterium]|nr:hypothetical protein [Rhodospirillaceae bacterium]
MADREIIYRYGQEGLEDLQRKLLEMAGAAQTAAKHIGEGSKTGSAGLKALDEATRQAKGIVEDFAGRAGPAGAIIAKLGPAGLAAAAGIGAVTAGMGFAIREAAKAEREMAKIEDRLRAQGGAARTSARALDGYANAVARTSSATEAELKAVIPEILGFQNIIGSTFKDVLQFSVNGIGSLSSNAIALAKALNDPFNELQALQKAFPALTDAQLESIKATAQQNGVFAAQAEIFADLRASVGGAGTAEANTLIGMYEQLRKAADHWTEAAGSNIVRLQGFRDLVGDITGFIEKQAERWGPEGQIKRREAQLSVMNPHDPQAKRIHEEIDALRLLIKAQADEEAALERLRARQREYADRNDKNARAIKAAEEEVTQYLEGVAKKAKAEEDLNKKIVEQRQEMYRQLALQREQESRAFAADMEKLRIDLEKSLKGPDAEFQTLPQVQAWIDETARAAERVKAINDETARDSYRAWREMFVDVLSND